MRVKSQTGFSQIILVVLILLIFVVLLYLLLKGSFSNSKPSAPNAATVPGSLSLPNSSPSAAPDTASPIQSPTSEVSPLNLNQMEFGFNTHLYVASKSNLNLDAFKKSVDVMAESQVKWIRFGLFDWEVAPSGSVSAINWNQTNLAKYDQAVDYAISKHLKIFMITNVPIYAKDYSLPDYLIVAKNYYQFLAQRYKGKVFIWQIGNEYNVHNFRDYTNISSTSPTYLSDLNSLISTASQALKSVDPLNLVTTNTGGYPDDDNLQTQWLQYLDAINGSLDFISLDFYPQENNAQITGLASKVNQIMSKYKKNVAIAEVGMCTSNTSAVDQGKYVPEFISSLKSANPLLILVYELRDDTFQVPSNQACESSFGVEDQNGVKKASFDSVVQSL